MSAIFPKSPASVTIRKMPKEASFVSYFVDDMLHLNAWMPDNFIEIAQENEISDDRFYDYFCDDCHRNCSHYYEQFMDEDGEIDDSDDILHNDCNVYHEGYSGQTCPEGNEQSKSYNFTVAPMVFSERIAHLPSEELPLLSTQLYTTWVQYGTVVDEDSSPKIIKSSYKYMAANVFGSESDILGICWGYNNHPSSLDGSVNSYFSSPFNNDLTSMEAFEDNCHDARRYMGDNIDSLRDSKDYYVGTEVDAVMVLHAVRDIQAFYTMLSAGFRPNESHRHLMIIPLKDSNIIKNDKVFEGYVTPEDAVGKNWFIMPDGSASREGVLLGQV